MRYINNGIEIQYRECQILRDAAKSFFEEDFKKGILKEKKEEWIQKVEKITISDTPKQKYGKILAKMLKGVEEKDFIALTEYTEYLVKKEKGIDIMCPFIAQNQVIILPVNKHMTVTEEYAEE